MRHKFDVQLLELKKKIVDMSDLVHKAIENAMEKSPFTYFFWCSGFK